jgi:hypothetical protein
MIVPLDQSERSAKLSPNCFSPPKSGWKFGGDCGGTLAAKAAAD